MSELDFCARTVLVVGGSSGIGNGIARAFRRKGADVHVWGGLASDHSTPVRPMAIAARDATASNRGAD